MQFSEFIKELYCAHRSLYIWSKDREYVYAILSHNWGICITYLYLCDIYIAVPHPLEPRLRERKKLKRGRGKTMRVRGEGGPEGCIAF